MRIKNLITFSVASMLMASANSYAESDSPYTTFTYVYETYSDKEFDNLGPSRAEYLGYGDQSRVSTGARENSVSVELEHIRQSALMDYTERSELLHSGTVDDRKKKLEIQQYNYAQYEELEKHEAAWDVQRKEELSTAQKFRAANNMSECNPQEYGGRNQRYICQDPTVAAREAVELEAIQERIDERNKLKSAGVVTSSGDVQGQLDAKALADELMSHANEDGIIENPDEVTKKMASKNFFSALPAHSAFCLMNIPIAITQPACKKAVCSVIGKRPCKALGF